MSKQSRLPSGDTPFKKLVDLMSRLRDPETGCAWDLEQTFKTIAPYTIEEAYEVLDAIEAGDMEDLRDELGDLLLQVVFHSQMADEAGLFNIDDVTNGITEKMVRRHPHVFGDAQARSAKMQRGAWEAQKADERAAKTANNYTVSALDGVATALPALLRSSKLQKRAARTGFDWTDPQDIFDKLHEETNEVRDAIQNGTQADIEEEIGGLLFVAANLARRLDVDPEEALRRANQKFMRRFTAMEEIARDKKVAFDKLDLDEQEALWQAVKKSEKKT